jgi:hypothetical protein
MHGFRAGSPNVARVFSGVLGVVLAGAAGGGPILRGISQWQMPGSKEIERPVTFDRLKRI